MPRDAKRQHYVPRFYLEWFATKEDGSRTPTFWVYDKQGGDPRRQTPINTAVEAHFYDLEHDGEPVPVERMLAEMESAAKPVLERWARGETDRRDIPLLARFLTDMYSRVPSNIAGVEESGTVLAREMLKASADDSDEEIAATIKGSGVEDVTVDQVREWYRNADTIVKKMDLPDGYWLAASLRQVPVVEAALLRMNWSLCLGPVGSAFIIGDTPLCTFAWMGEKVAIFGGGIWQPRSEVTFPLSPSACLLITRWVKPERMPMTAGWVREVNRRTARIAERYVIAPYRSADVDALVDEARASYGKPKVDPAAVAAHYRAEKERERSAG